MVKVGVICLHAKDWKRGAEFWAAALGYAPHPQAPDILVDPDGDAPSLGIYGDQTHLDLHPTDGSDQAAEVERLIALGAERVPDWPYPEGADFVVLRDPEGNLFCVLEH